MTNIPSRLVAIFEGVFVALTWASSFVFVKIGLEYMGPITLAGLRYFLAFLILLPLMMYKRAKAKKTTTSGNGRLFQKWGYLAAIGISAYTIGNAALFWGLKYLPATTGSFMMTLIPLLVLLAGVIWLDEIPTRFQLIGIAVALAGGLLFFGPGLGGGEPLGLVVMSGGLLGFTAFSILGRKAAKTGEIDTLTLTAIPLGIGGGFLLLIALLVEGWPVFSFEGLGVILFLAIINTALAYAVYNHALKVLTAIEMNMILNLSPLGTAVLAWILLGEKLTLMQVAGMVVVIIGVVLVEKYGAAKNK